MFVTNLSLPLWMSIGAGADGHPEWPTANSKNIWNVCLQLKFAIMDVNRHRRRLTSRVTNWHNSKQMWNVCLQLGGHYECQSAPAPIDTRGQFQLEVVMGTTCEGLHVWSYYPEWTTGVTPKKREMFCLQLELAIMDVNRCRRRLTSRVTNLA